MSKRWRSMLLLTLKLALGAGLLIWLIASDKLKGEDFRPAWGHPWYLLAAFGLVAVVPFLGGLRWWMLLRCQGFSLSYLRVLHLTLVGFFFNCFSIGHTGGDIVKAYYAAVDQARGRRAEAVYTVGFDRAVGLYALVAVGTVALFSNPARMWADPMLRIFGLVLGVALLVVTFGFTFMFSPRFRESKTIGPKLEKIPGGKLFLRFYRSVKLYRKRPEVLLAALGLSTLAHGFTFGALWMAGLALGMPEKLTDPDLTVMTFVFCVAVGLTIGAVGPPLGLGFGQMAFGYFFSQTWGEIGLSKGGALATVHQGVMLCINLAMGLPAFLMVRRQYRTVLAEIKEDESTRDGEESAEAGGAPAAASPEAPEDV